MQVFFSFLNQPKVDVSQSFSFFINSESSVCFQKVDSQTFVFLHQTTTTTTTAEEEL
jgi:hypothetical protein